MKENNLGKNTIFNLIKTLSQVFFPLITVPYISRVLHAENVGKLNFGQSITGYINLAASLGIATYAIRECSCVKGDQKRMEDVASQILSINFLSTALAYLMLAGLLLFWHELDGYKTLIMIQSTAILFNTLGADWINTAMEDFRFIAVRTFVMQIVSLIAMFAFVHEPQDYLKYAIITVVASSGANIINIFYRRKFCRIHFTFRIDWKLHMKPVFMLFALLLAQQIFVNVDITMLGVMRGDYDVGLYSTATKIYLMVNQVIASIAWVVMPSMSLYFREKNYPEINRLLRYTLNIIIVLGVPCVIGMAVIAPEILEIVAGVEYVGGATALRILSLALLLSLMSGFIGNIILLPSGRENICLMSCLISAAVNFVLNLVLIPSFGMNAAAFTTALSQMITLIVGFFFIEKEIRIDKIGEIIKGPIVGGGLIVAIGILGKYFIAGTFLRAMVVILLSVIIYGISVLVSGNELAKTWKDRIKIWVTK